MKPDPAESRRRVLDASLRLVAEQGVRAVSFREVARRAGVSHQAPYHHFGNSRGILRAIAEEGFSRLNDAMAAAAGAAGADTLAALTAAGIAYVRFAADHPAHFQVMFQRPLYENPDATTGFTEGAATHATLDRLVRAAHADGHGAVLPAHVLVDVCWSVVHGIATLHVEGVDRASPEPEASAAHLRAVVEGLARLMAC